MIADIWNFCELPQFFTKHKGLLLHSFMLPLARKYKIRKPHCWILAEKYLKHTANLHSPTPTVIKGFITIHSSISHSDTKYQLKPLRELMTNKDYLNSNLINHEWTRTTCSKFYMLWQLFSDDSVKLSRR